MISVCMATYNGAKYLKEQIDSILCQLANKDELVISDDGSSDRTLDILNTYNDKRIRVINNKGKHGVTYNFENSLLAARGDIVFLADQDDVWKPEKIREMVDFMHDGDLDLVSCSCSVTNSDLKVIQEDYFSGTGPSDQSLLMNLLKNKWLGCCMAFRREILKDILPIPDKVIAHDVWIGIQAQLRFKCGYYPKPLQYYRRHDATVSFAGLKSKNPIFFRIAYRWNLVKAFLLNLNRH